MDCFYVIVLDRGSDRAETFSGPILDEIIPPYHPVIQSWSNTWAGLMEMDGSEKVLESFDQYLPKAQAIIARKK